MRCKRLLFLSFWGALILPILLPAQDNEVRSIVEDWRETLQYGINSQIAELLPMLTENEEEELAPEVVALFNESENGEILTESARYLTALGIPDGLERAEAILSEPIGRSDDTIVAVMNYLAKLGSTLSSETYNSIKQIVENRLGAPATAGIGLLSDTGYPTDQLIEMYREGDLSVDARGRILVELGERKDPDLFPFLQELIDEDEEATTTLQRYAIDTLGKLGDPRGLPTIIRQFDSNDALTRAYATSALSNFDTPEANEALIGALRDEFWRVRVASLESIAERKLQEAVPAVMYKARRDPEQRVRVEAIETLAALDDKEGWTLMEEIVLQRDTSIDVKSAIIDHMIRERPGGSRDIILELIEKEWSIPNSQILDVIGRVVSTTTDQSIEPIVARLIDHPNYLIQIYALRAVGENRLMSLVEIANDRGGEGNHRAVRSTAIRALEQLGVAYRDPSESPESELPENGGDAAIEGEEKTVGEGEDG